MVKSDYIPDQGDIVYFNFSPSAGREQKGFRPGIVISRIFLNQPSGLAVICPITSKQKFYPFEVLIKTDKISGVALVDHARQDLAENEGMLFIFAESRQHPFWMKDMKFPIDIIWLNENMSIVYIKKDARPESYPKIYSPDKDSKYVLEVVSGFAEKHALKIGDKIEFIH